jgi:(+)-neomenthol dehydrogenase
MQLSGMDMDQRLGWLWINCRETYETAKEGLRINYYGTKHVTETLLPLLQASADGRIVNVSSHFGQLRVSSLLITTSMCRSMKKI